jgi:cytochrome oxidase assembly protein ShyY1
MYRFARRPRWVVLHIIMLVAMPLFAVAGFWQLRRLDERRTSNALVTGRQELPPVTDLDDDDARFRRAELVGAYDHDNEVLLTGRPSNGRPGDHLLTPLHTEGGRVIVVDRGWLESGAEVDTPDGTVTVEGVLLPSEGRAPFTSGKGTAGRTTRIDLDSLDARNDDDLEPLYLLLRKQQPAQDSPVPAELVKLSEGSHLSYAVQWFLFIPTAIVVYVLVLRREARKEERLSRTPATG